MADRERVLMPIDQSLELKRIADLRTTDGRLVRCDGTPDELDSYRRGLHAVGWSVRAPADVGDLLIACVGTGRARLIVSLCRVEDVAADGSVMWEEATDISIKPSVPWSAVISRDSSLRPRVWRSADGAEVGAFLDALVGEVAAQTDTSEEEGRKSQSICRARSRHLRARALDEASGRCKGCDINLRAFFGVRGNRGLEVHHRVPLSRSFTTTVSTTLRDLVVLCATCHRLIHADPELSLDRLRTGWSTTMESS